MVQSVFCLMPRGVRILGVRKRRQPTLTEEYQTVWFFFCCLAYSVSLHRTFELITTSVLAVLRCAVVRLIAGFGAEDNHALLGERGRQHVAGQ